MQLYIHIPFCKSKCAYCDFNSYADFDEATIFAYLTALKREIVLAAETYKNAVADTLYIGGGTPSLLDAKHISSVIDCVRKNFKTELKECSIECNPESVTAQKLQIYKDAGVDRISLGVQSLCEDNLRSVGRIHTAKQAMDSLGLCSAFFENVSADLIIGLPYDTVKLVERQVDELASAVEHLSVYALTLEENTPLAERVAQGRVILADEDESAELFEAALKSAYKNGFERYEVSNFAKEGKISIHNYGYWLREEYLGLGAGASSFIKTSDGKKKLERQIRFSSFSHINRYIAGVNCANDFGSIIRREFGVLNEEDVLYEELMLGLRTREGVDSRLLKDKSLDGLEKFFVSRNGKTALTDEGMAVMNSILLRII